MSGDSGHPSASICSNLWLTSIFPAPSGLPGAARCPSSESRQGAVTSAHTGLSLLADVPGAQMGELLPDESPGSTSGLLGGDLLRQAVGREARGGWTCRVRRDPCRLMRAMGWISDPLLSPSSLLLRVGKLRPRGLLPIGGEMDTGPGSQMAECVVVGPGAGWGEWGTRPKPQQHRVRGWPAALESGLLVQPSAGALALRLPPGL